MDEVRITQSKREIKGPQILFVFLSQRTAGPYDGRFGYWIEVIGFAEADCSSVMVASNNIGSEISYDFNAFIRIRSVANEITKTHILVYRFLNASIYLLESFKIGMNI